MDLPQRKLFSPGRSSNYNLKSATMRKKQPASRIPKPKRTPLPADESWHNEADVEIVLYARSLQNAAKTLVEKLDLEPNPKSPWDACPVIHLYRQAVELQLKMLVGEGNNVLKSPVDHITQRGSILLP